LRSRHDKPAECEGNDEDGKDYRHASSMGHGCLP
jgi:hypothetical protein